MKTFSLLLSLILFLGCSSKRYLRYKTEEFIIPMEYTFFEHQGDINFEIIEYYPNNFICYSHSGIAFGIFIGKVNDVNLSDTISFLAPCEDRNFIIGQKLIASPILKSSDLRLFETTYSEITKGHKITQVLGVQYPAFWCEVESINN